MITTNNDEYSKGIQNLRCMSNQPQSWNDQLKDINNPEWHFGKIVCKKTDPIEYWLPAHFDVIPWNGHWGSNYRMNEIQAAVGCCQLDKLDMLVSKRREIAHKITAGLQDIDGIEPVYEPAECYHSFHLYTLCVDETAGIFGLMAVLGFVSKGKLSGIWVVMIGLLVGAGMLAGINFLMILFGQISETNVTLSWIVSLLIFAFLMLMTMWDVARINSIATRTENQGKNLIYYCAYILYSDFIAILIRVIRYVAIFTRRS